MNLSTAIAGAAHKRLVAVDLPGTASHQHELNGVVALKALFGTESKHKRDIRWFYFSDAQEPEHTTSSVTFYDARAKSAHLTGRSEWRLYYEGGFLSRARPGDHIIFVLTTRGDLFGLIFQEGSKWFAAAAILFSLPDTKTSFSTVTAAQLAEIEVAAAEKKFLASFGKDDVGTNDSNAECGTSSLRSAATEDGRSAEFPELFSPLRSLRPSVQTFCFGKRNPHMQPKAIAHAVEEAADGHFRGGVLAADAAHVPTAALFGQAV